MMVEEMTQLVGEIQALRGAREELLTGLRDEAAGLSRSVSATLDGFHRSRMRLAREAKGQRYAFVVALRDGVAEFRNEFGSDIADVRRVWSRSGSAGAGASKSSHFEKRSGGRGMRRTSHSKGKP